MKFLGKSRGGVSFESRLDLTPLIDCIFQLILFLVLTTQITLRSEDVKLPVAIEGKEAALEGEDVPPLVVSVVRDQTPGKSGSRAGLIVYNGQPHDASKLEAELLKEARYDAVPRPEGRGRGWEKGAGDQKLSRLSVLVRADRDVEARYLHDVFESCQKAGIYRLKAAIVQPD